MDKTRLIAILGAGNVGGALGKIWSAEGYKIAYGVRDPKNSKRDVAADATVSTNDEAAAQASIVVLTVPWNAAKQAVESCGDLSGKVIIDCTNPLTDDLKGLALGTTTSAAEMIANWVPGANVVKAFNTIGAPCLGNAQFGSEAADGFYCGDDAEAKSVVKPLIAATGLNPADMGPLRNARQLEALAMLWIDLAVNQGQGVNHGFKLLRR